MKVFLVLYLGQVEKIFDSYEKAKEYYYDAKMFCNENDYTIQEYYVN